MMDESNRSNSSQTANQKITTPYLNKPINCPWTSRAPLTSASNHKNSSTLTENCKLSFDTHALREQHGNTTSINNGTINKSIENHQASSTQFFHFLRLMQLFPDVHPATLHTVMTLCRNDFFSTVDKLLYAKRCKDLIMKRRQFLLPNNKPKIRYQPYTCTPNCHQDNIKITLNNEKNETVNSGQPANNQPTPLVSDTSFPCRPMDSKRMVYRNKSKLKDLKIDTELTPVASPQCELPIKPLSPPLDVAQDLTRQNIK